MKKNILKQMLFIMILSLSFLLAGCKQDNGQLFETFVSEFILDQKITEDLNLKNEYNLGNIKIKVEWESSKPEVISNLGKVTRKLEDEKVELKATFTYGENKITKTFHITVVKMIKNKALKDYVDKYDIESQKVNKLNLKTHDVSEGIEIDIKWSSSDEKIITLEGNIYPIVEEKVVYITGTFTNNEDTETRVFEIKVKPFSAETIGQLISQTVVTNEVFEDEVKPTESKSVKGRISNELFTSKDKWRGIETIVTIGDYELDEKRKMKRPFSEKLRYSDKPIITLKGYGEYTLEAGISLSLGGLPDLSKIDDSKVKYFRPFWQMEKTQGQLQFATADWKDTDFYYFPGDKIKISLYNYHETLLQLRIELLEETTIPKYVAMRNAFSKSSENRKVYYSNAINTSSANRGEYMMSFSRNCSINQMDRSGVDIVRTSSKFTNTIFHETSVYRIVDGVYRKVYLDDTRSFEDNTKGFINIENQNLKKGSSKITIAEPIS